MPVDASIPLSVNIPKPTDLIGEYGKVADLQATLQQNEMRNLQMQQMKAEAEAFKGADFSTPEGRNAALVKVMQSAPQAGVKLMQTFSNIEKNQAQTKHWTSQANLDDLKTVQGKQKAIADAALPAWNAYQKALQEGKPDMVARAEADKYMPQAISSIQQSGTLSQDELAKLPRTFDPVSIGSALMSTGTYSKMISDRLHEAQTSAAEKTAALREEQTQHPEKFHQTRETGSQLVEDKDGNLFSVNPNKPDEAAKPVTGLPKGAHKLGTGGAANAKPNIRAATVAASARNSMRMMDQIQKEFGDSATTSMIFKQHPTGLGGTMVNAALKKVIPDKELKLDADANSLIDEAGPTFTGGLRVNTSFREFLMNQLPSPGDPPGVAKRKWDNFRANLTGSNDTFRRAYSGNPEYWSKDDKGHVVDPNSDPNYVKPATQGGQKQAPQGAIDYLKQHPELKDQFKEKYGYLPEGM